MKVSSHFQSRDLWHHGSGKFHLLISQSATITAHRSLIWPSASAAHCKADKDTCYLGCNVGSSSARHKSPQVSPLMSLIITSSTRPLIASFAQPFFPSLRPFMYIKHIVTLDRATFMYTTGRPRNVHFLAARGSFSSGKPFVRESFPTQKIGASAPRTFLRVPMPTKQFINIRVFLSMHTWRRRIDHMPI